MFKRFGSEKMNSYFLYLDKFNYHQCQQKDRLMSKDTSHTNLAGPFVLQCMFERFKGDMPINLSDRVEYLTDFWKMIPFTFNMSLMRHLSDIKRKQEKYYVISFLLSLP